MITLTRLMLRPSPSGWHVVCVYEPFPTRVCQASASSPFPEGCKSRHPMFGSWQDMNKQCPKWTCGQGCKKSKKPTFFRGNGKRTPEEIFRMPLPTLFVDSCTTPHGQNFWATWPFFSLIWNKTKSLEGIPQSSGWSFLRCNCANFLFSRQWCSFDRHAANRAWWIQSRIFLVVFDTRWAQISSFLCWQGRCHLYPLQN